MSKKPIRFLATAHFGSGNLFSSLLIACVLIVPSLPAHAIAFTKLYAFGDSLNDNGNVHNISQALNASTGGLFPALLPDHGPGTIAGRSSSGQVAAEVLAQRLGFTLTPYYQSAPPPLGTGATSVTGALNFSQVNANTGLDPATLPVMLNLPGVPVPLPTGFKGILGQIDDYITSQGGADPNALHMIWGGANDFFFLPPSADPLQTAASAAQNIVSAVTTLAAAGARHFLIPNLPDLGRTPDLLELDAIVPGAAGLATLYTVTFNTLLKSLLDGFDLASPALVVQFDTFGLFSMVLNDPAAFGFTNVTQGCLTGSTAFATSVPSSACAGTPADPANYERYVFWDGAHPTARAHAILANGMYAQIPEPGSIALVLLGMGAMAWYFDRGQGPSRRNRSVDFR